MARRKMDEGRLAAQALPITLTRFARQFRPETTGANGERVAGTSMRLKTGFYPTLTFVRRPFATEMERRKKRKFEGFTG